MNRVGKKVFISAVVALGVMGVGGYAYLQWLWRPPVFDVAEVNIAEEDKDFAQPIKIKVGPPQADGFPASLELFDHLREVPMVYTGKMLRVKKVLLSVKLYEIASYVEEPKKGEPVALLDELLTDAFPKVYAIRFIASLPGRTILNDIYNEINMTFGDVDMVRLKPNIDRFVQQFARGSKKGDWVFIVWMPGGRIYSSFDAPEKVEFIGHDVPLARAIWRIWAGPKSHPERLGLVERFSTGTTKR